MSTKREFTFTAVIICPLFNCPSYIKHSKRVNSDYWLDGRKLYDNIYYANTELLDPNDTREYARHFLRRMIVRYQRKENKADDNLSGHTLEWRWNGQSKADDNYYPSGRYAECTWVQDNKVEKVELDKELLDLVEIDMMRQSDTFWYGSSNAEQSYLMRLSILGAIPLEIEDD